MFLHLRNDCWMKKENAHHFFPTLEIVASAKWEIFSTLSSPRLRLKWTSADRYQRFCATPPSPTKLITKFFFITFYHIHKNVFARYVPNFLSVESWKRFSSPWRHDVEVTSSNPAPIRGLNTYPNWFNTLRGVVSCFLRNPDTDLTFCYRSKR